MYHSHCRNVFCPAASNTSILFVRFPLAVLFFSRLFVLFQMFANRGDVFTQTRTNVMVRPMRMDGGCWECRTRDGICHQRKRIRTKQDTRSTKDTRYTQVSYFGFNKTEKSKYLRSVICRMNRQEQKLLITRKGRATLTNWLDCLTSKTQRFSSYFWLARVVACAYDSKRVCDLNAPCGPTPFEATATATSSILSESQSECVLRCVEVERSCACEIRTRRGFVQEHGMVACLSEAPVQKLSCR